ncbi:MAG: matrixin family metalloprotease, partial [Planctomycetota bacterium]
MIRFTWALALTTLIFSMPSYGYILSERWTNTATDGGGLQFGDPTTITWSIIPDGTNISGEGPSDFIAAMDNIIGAGPGGSDLTQRPWFTLLEQSFGRWEELGGITHVYEPNDIGGSSPGSDGVLGSRGDVRIGGVFQDGNSGVLAFNYFPSSGGDMVLDTGDTNIIGNSSNNFRAFRNIIMHEHGHGIGISHIESSNANFLMEPFLATSFDGPQLDDIRALHRGYGDKFEKENNGNGNDTIGNAIALGSPTIGSPLVIGTAGDQTAVPASETDFVSIDQNTDTDFFSMLTKSVSEAGTAVWSPAVPMTSGLPMVGEPSAMAFPIVS